MTLNSNIRIQLNNIDMYNIIYNVKLKIALMLVFFKITIYKSINIKKKKVYRIINNYVNIIIITIKFLN